MSTKADKLITAPFVHGTLAVDEFETRVWNHCHPITIDHYWSGVSAPSEKHCQARTCWTTDSLEILFTCEQHQPLIVADEITLDRKTLGLWDRDVCEVFLAPDAQNPRRYFEFQAAPTGEWVDLGIVVTPNGRQTDWDYFSSMATASRIETTKISIRMSIPWNDDLTRPVKGVEWRANYFRCIGTHPTERYLAWLPTRTTEPNFHVPDAFGTLRFE